MSISVVIVDDENLVRIGIRLVLEATDDIDVVADAPDGAEGVRVARDLRPDIVLLDVHMPSMNGLEAARQILHDRTSETRVIMLTTFDRDEHVYEAMDAGASGFLLESAPPKNSPGASDSSPPETPNWRRPSPSAWLRTSSSGRLPGTRDRTHSTG